MNIYVCMYLYIAKELEHREMVSEITFYLGHSDSRHISTL